MGIFDFFKKKEEPPSFDPNIAPMDDLGQDVTGLGGAGMLQNVEQPPQNFPPLEPAHQAPNTFPTNTFAPHNEPVHNDLMNKNIEIISYKIDALKASLDSMSQRLANIEAIARGEQEKAKYRW